MVSLLLNSDDAVSILNALEEGSLTEDEYVNYFSDELFRNYKHIRLMAMQRQNSINRFTKAQLEEIEDCKKILAKYEVLNNFPKIYNKFRNTKIGLYSCWDIEMLEKYGNKFLLLGYHGVIISNKGLTTYTKDTKVNYFDMQLEKTEYCRKNMVAIYEDMQSYYLENSDGTLNEFDLAFSGLEENLKGTITVKAWRKKVEDWLKEG